MSATIAFCIGTFAAGVLVGLIFGPSKEALDAARTDGFVSGMQSRPMSDEEKRRFDEAFAHFDRGFSTMGTMFGKGGKP